MITDQDLNSVLKRVIAHSRQSFGGKLKEIILYGSYARGEQECDSDIDIMILVDERSDKLGQHRRSLSQLTSSLDLEYGAMVSPLLKDSETFEFWKGVLPFYKSVDSEGKRIHV